MAAEAKEKVTITAEHIDRATGKVVPVGAVVEVDAERKEALRAAGVIGGKAPETASRAALRTAADALKEREAATRKGGEAR